MQGFCDFCNSVEKKKIVAIMGGQNICNNCNQKHFNGQQLSQVRPCPSCGNKDPELVRIYGEQLYCGVCSNVYHMKKNDFVKKNELDIALSHLHCMN